MGMILVVFAPLFAIMAPFGVVFEAFADFGAPFAMVIEEWLEYFSF